MTSRPGTEQLLIQVLMRAAQEVLRTLEHTSDDAPERSRAEHELELAFAPIWSRVPYLELTCLDDSLGWRESIVLSPDADEFGLTRTLVTSGIHRFILVPGCEKDEMARFLALVDTKRRLDEDGDQDLVLMLFRADLQCVRYTVGAVPSLQGPPVDRGSDPSALPTTELATTELPATLPEVALDLPVAPEALRAEVRADAEEEDDGRRVVQLEKFDSTLYFLDQREIEYLRGAIDRHSAQDHSRSALDLLLDILQLRSEPEVRTRSSRSSASSCRTCSVLAVSDPSRISRASSGR
jgi:hypothetical protein